MSQQNVQIVREVFDREARRDMSVLDAYNPDVEMDFSASPFADFMTMSGRRQGLGEVQSTFRDWYEAFENVETDVHELIDAGEHVIVVFTYRGRGRVSGAEVEWKQMAGLWTFRKGKVVRVVWLRTRAEALEAVGLSDG
jgi:ketosteroid isomerase-like protein